MENPFSPGYGEAPPYMAGRDELVNAAIEALRRGPGRAGYHRILIGPRGSGKTTAISAIAEHAAREHGAAILRWTAGSRPLDDAVATGAEIAERALRSRLRRSGAAVDTSATVGLPGVASATATHRRADQRRSTFAQMERLARLGEQRKRAVVVWVDEAQAATAAEIATLVGVMQELSNVARLPVAVWAAGLPETRDKWIDAASPLERQRFTKLGNLGADATAAAFEVPIRDAGRAIEPDALATLVQGSAGFPYAIQLMGAGAWDADNVATTIGSAAAHAGIEYGIATLREQMFVARWRQMSPAIRDYVRAAATLEDPATGSISSSAIALHLGMTTAAVSTRRADLIATHQVVRSEGRDQLAFTQPGFGAWVRDLDHQRSRDQFTARPPRAAEAIPEGWRGEPPHGGRIDGIEID